MDLMYDKASGTWIEKPEPYAVIEVATKEEYEKLEALVKAMNAKKDTESHSETEIVKGCIALMQELTGQFETYLEFMGINPDTEEERFSVEYSYFCFGLRTTAAAHPRWRNARNSALIPAIP